jgi:predicted pyridoxine 5'-phosphate oxidase superfamily flavin-nucleotide-binding protein
MASVKLPDASTAFHKGELAAQAKAGLPDKDARMRARAIRPLMPDQHRAFFNKLPFMITGALDKTGQPWASAAFGPQGFVNSPDPQTLVMGAPPLLMSELDMQVEAGSKVGLVGIELQTRRRNRVNTVVTAQNAQGLIMKVDQSFGNCPQYIQTRELTWRSDRIDPRDRGPALETKTTEKVAHRIISAADVFFIASRTAELSDDPRSGVDASHRGGKPGFVRVGEDGRLSFPDFSGNLFFNTIGNIQSDPRVGLFFPDFESGDAVFLAGEAEVEWDGPNVEAFKGAERLIHVTPSRVILGKSILPIQGSLVDTWPILQETGSWDET